MKLADWAQSFRSWPSLVPGWRNWYMRMANSQRGFWVDRCRVRTSKCSSAGSCRLASVRQFIGSAPAELCCHKIAVFASVNCINYPSLDFSMEIPTCRLEHWVLLLCRKDLWTENLWDQVTVTCQIYCNTRRLKIKWFWYAMWSNAIDNEHLPFYRKISMCLQY